jgi:hypothetical protein
MKTDDARTTEDVERPITTALLTEEVVDHAAAEDAAQGAAEDAAGPTATTRPTEEVADQAAAEDAEEGAARAAAPNPVCITLRGGGGLMNLRMFVFHRGTRPR